jgi:hypothetical protein
MNSKPITVVTAFILLISGLMMLFGCAKSQSITEPKAAIIDQLYTNQPNQLFLQQTTDLLNGYGLKVDTYKGDEVTVDFLRRLPDQGYRLIIFRAHSGLLGSGGKAIPKTCVFTNESYSETRHTAEQFSEKLAKARINADYPWVFAVGSDFVSHSMQGRFQQTIVIMMGCSTLYIDDLARSFVDKGASAYIGWDASVGLDFVDSATLTLLKNIGLEKATLASAVAATLKECGRDPDFGAVLKYYPSQSGNQSLFLTPNSK